MALKINEFYTPRSIAPTADYPTGSFKNRSIPGAVDGTPLLAADRNDLQGFTDALLALGGVVPSGSPDTALASDRLDALLQVIEDQTGYIYITGGGTLQINKKYLIGDSGTYTLPDTSDLATSDRTDVSKLPISSPVIQCNNIATEQIRFGTSASNISDLDSVLYDITERIVFSWSGTYWGVNT